MCSTRPPVEFAPGYKVTACGLFWGARVGGRGRDGAWRLMRLRPSGPGYRGIRIPGIGWRNVHREVALAFIPNPTGLPVVRHLDGDPLNNIVSNLAWGTQKDNADDSRRHGTMATGASKVTKGQAVSDLVIGMAVALVQNGDISQGEAARILGVKQGTVSRWVTGASRRDAVEWFWGGAAPTAQEAV